MCEACPTMIDHNAPNPGLLPDEEGYVAGSGMPLMDRLRNLQKGYDRRFALCYLADEVWAALEEALGDSE